LKIGVGLRAPDQLRTLDALNSKRNMIENQVRMQMYRTMGVVEIQIEMAPITYIDTISAKSETLALIHKRNDSFF
jgi:hypothetical protein